MAGKFLNMNMKVTIESLETGVKNKIKNNAFYAYLDKKHTIVTFYNPNIELSTLDDSTKQIYEAVGPQSGLRFNKINDVMLFNIDKILLNVDMGDWGPESDPIEGEAILPPNTFEPYQEGFFTINHIDKKLFFRVIGVTPDTIDNGANFYKINYRFDGIDLNIDRQIVQEFTMISGNIGTDYKSVITNNDYYYIDALQETVSTLRDYYISLFFKNRVQTYIFSHHDTFFYDPYMVEFIIRNGILDKGNGASNYIFIDHQVFLHQTFRIDYDKSIFRYLETQNSNFDYSSPYAVLIEDPSSLLTTRMEDYYMIDYKLKLGVVAEPIDIIDNDLLECITKNRVMDTDSQKEYYNIIGAYFNKKDISKEMIDTIENIEYASSIEVFYTIPMLIYILEKNIIDLLKTDKLTLS